MSLLQKIQTGRENRPPSILIFGQEGTGKSTCASQSPNPIFIQTEDTHGRNHQRNQVLCASPPCSFDIHHPGAPRYANKHTNATHTATRTLGTIGVVMDRIKEYSFRLPWPPSTNAYYRTFKPRILISRNGRSYRRDVVSLLRNVVTLPLQGEVALRADFYPPDKCRRDLDNVGSKAFLDALQHAGCFVDKAQELGCFDLAIVDECLLIPESGEGRYRTFLNDAKKINPNLRIIGLTATPYRTSSGLICKPENLLNEVCYEGSVRFFIGDGYLSKIHSKSSKESVNTDNLHIRAGEFLENETEVLLNTDEVVSRACTEIIRHTKERKSVIIFCCSVAHATSVQKELNKTDSDVRLIVGDTPKDERAKPKQKVCPTCEEVVPSATTKRKPKNDENIRMGVSRPPR